MVNVLSNSTFTYAKEYGRGFLGAITKFTGYSGMKRGIANFFKPIKGDADFFVISIFVIENL